jgi:sugar/nucleoside kinase (ribokinase family)
VTKSSIESNRPDNEAGWEGASMITVVGEALIHVRASGSVIHWPPASPARLVDRSGAKETFTAVLLGALHDRAQKGEGVRTLPAPNLAHLLGMATLGAGIACERAGPDSPTAAELEERACAQASQHNRRFIER